MHTDSSSSAGTPLIVTPTAPGVHGISTGVHGTGVSTPRAAAVAAITSGLAGAEHIPNVGMFSASTSVTTPAGVVAETSSPDAVNSQGATPNAHSTNAPVETSTPITFPLPAYSEGLLLISVV